MKKLFSFLMVASLAITIQAQDITAQPGATGNFKVNKSDGLTNLFTISETGDHTMQISASANSFTINNALEDAIFFLNDKYSFKEIAHLRVGDAETDWLGTSNFSNLQLQSTSETKLHLVHVGSSFNTIAGYRATAGPGVLTNNSAMLAMYAYGYDGTAYDYTGGILISTDGTYSSQIPSKIDFLTATNSAAPVTNMTIKGDGKVGIGTETPTSTFEVNGTMSLSNVVTLATSYTMGDSDYTLIGSQTGTLTVTLPEVTSAIDGRVYVIKRRSDKITIDPNGSQTIDGLTTFDLDAANEFVVIQAIYQAASPAAATWVAIGGKY